MRESWAKWIFVFGDVLDPSIVKISLTTFCLRRVRTTRAALTGMYIFGQHIAALAGKGNTEALDDVQ
jgi:hypothetical protein